MKAYSLLLLVATFLAGCKQEHHQLSFLKVTDDNGHTIVTKIFTRVEDCLSAMEHMPISITLAGTGTFKVAGYTCTEYGSI